MYSVHTNSSVSSCNSSDIVESFLSNITIIMVINNATKVIIQGTIHKSHLLAVSVILSGLPLTGIIYNHLVIFLTAENAIVMIRIAALKV